jgi:hypothetical protein
VGGVQVRRRDIVECIAISVISWALAVVGAAAFMALVSCGGRGQACPPPKHAAISAGGQSPGGICEARK